MKKNNIAIFWAITALLIAMAGCGTKPTAPAHSNPADPLNPDFQEPGVELTAGPSEGSTVNASTATFRWRGTGSAALFSYCLDDTMVWSAWAKDTIKAYSSLLEGPHIFRIRAADAGGYQGDTVRARSFTTNAVNNAIMLYPKVQTVVAGDTAVFWCELEDMATPVAGAKITFFANYNYLDTVGTSADTGIMWSKNGGSPLGPFFSASSYVYYFDLNMGVAGGTPAGVAGSGRICKFKLVAISSNSVYIVSADVRDTLNNPITGITFPNSCYVYVTAKKEGAK